MTEVTKLEQQLLEFEQTASKSLSEAQTLADVESARQEFLGQKGALTNILRSLAQVDKQDRPRLGQSANSTKEKLESLYQERKTFLDSQELAEKLKTEKIDITLPARGKKLGHLHPLTQILSEIENIFLTMGFTPVEGPEVETEYYNFDALNFPPDHPSRDEQDTFYTSTGKNVVLRCHTSSVQARAMENSTPPLRVTCAGRVYRNEEINARKYPVFHQVEGLLIDRNVSFGQLKGTLNEFIRLLFGKPLKTRFRPDFFPFTEPSAELDSECPFCDGTGCKTCGYKGWLELLGCGMVDPAVLKAVNIDPEIWNGFAFGMGVERLAMLKYGITDIRHLYNNDMRFLEQF
jgi:phenylalanyl-tRNA synthetase alpha chain